MADCSKNLGQTDPTADKNLLPQPTNPQKGLGWSLQPLEEARSCPGSARRTSLEQSRGASCHDGDQMVDKPSSIFLLAPYCGSVLVVQRIPNHGQLVTVVCKLG